MRHCGPTSGALQETSPSLSVVIPAFNEEGRLLPYLSSIVQYCSQRAIAHEILVVDDGSVDGTARVIADVAALHPTVRLIRLDRNRGKGAAVRTGMQQAEGTLCVFTDADGATPIEEVERLETALDNGADLAIGSRVLASRDPQYQVKTLLHRTIIGALFNAVVRRFGVQGLRDTQCGFKLFRKAVSRDLFSVSTINGFGFDLELLYVAQRRGYRIAEVPINWSDQPGSKVSLLRDGYRVIGELLAIRRNARHGVYGLPAHRRPLPLTAPLAPKE